MYATITSENYYCDSIIWDSFKTGDKKAYATLYSRFSKLLMQNCLKYSNDRNLIEDCIHDLFLEIWNNKLNLVTPESVKAYLLSSTQRKIVHIIKKNRKRQKSIGNDIELKVAFSVEENIITEQIYQEKSMGIKIALNSLTKRQKEAVCLRYYNGLGYKEIATQMNIGTASVYNLVSKAIDNIQKEIHKKTNCKPTESLKNISSL